METNNKPDNHIDFFAPKVLWTIIGVLMFVVVVGSIAWYDVIKNTPKVDQQVTTNPTAEWKTYSNNEYGFEFKYPSSYDVGSPTGKITNSLTLYTNEPYYDRGTFTLDFYFNFKKGTLPVITSTGTGDDKKIGKEKIGNIEWAKWQFGGMNGNYGYVTTQNNITVEVDTPIWSDSLKNVLATFKFTGSDYSVITVGNSKKYTNHTLGFEITFPKEWPDPAISEETGKPYKSIYISDGKFEADGCCKGVQIDVAINQNDNDQAYTAKEPDALSDKKVTLAGQEVREIVSNTQIGANARTTLVLHNNDLFYLRRAENDKSADQIVSTFKFTK